MIVIAGLVIVAVAAIAGVAVGLARASLAKSRRETAVVSQHRDDLIRQRDTARAYTVLDEQRNYTASTLGGDDGSPRSAQTSASAPAPAE
jgi:hypothetical protein